jgi:hypothetical protein
MNKKLIVIFVVMVLVLSSFAMLAATSVSAQESAGNDTTTTTPNNTTTEASNGGGGVDVEVPIGQLLRPQDDKTNSPDTVVVDLDDVGHIYDIEYHPDDEFVVVYFNIDRAGSNVKIADGNYESPAGTSYFTSQNLNLPEGKTKIKLQNDHIDGQQCISLNGDGTPDDQGVLHCGSGPTKSLLEQVVTVGIFLLCLTLFSLAAFIKVGRWVRTHDNTGQPRTKDGIELPEDKVYGDFEFVDGGDTDDD